MYEIIYNVNLNVENFICHKCDNPPCCNPEHLFLGTHLSNMEDRKIKGRTYITSGEKSGMHKLKTKDVLKIREDNRSLRVIANEYGVSKSNISMIKNRKSRKYE